MQPSLTIPFYLFIKVFFDVDHFVVVLSLLCCEKAFSGCGEQRLLFTVGHGLLTTVASLVAEHSL